MNKIAATLILLMCGLLIGKEICAKKEQKMNYIENDIVRVTSIADIKALIPQSVQQIQQETEQVLALVKKNIETILAIPNDQRTFANTIRALDILTDQSLLSVKGNIFQTLEMTHPDASIRSAAHDAFFKIESYCIDMINTNPDLYKACKYYAVHTAAQENLTTEEKYFLEQLIARFERAGLHLPSDTLEVVKKLKKEMAQLSLEFERNLAEDKSFITVDEEALKGLNQDFIAQLKRTDDGNYVLGVDYPTYYNVIENCEVSETRRKLMRAFTNRAYPANHEVLTKLIRARDEYAKLIGFTSYAQLDLADQMVKTPERAQQFLEELLHVSKEKATQEFLDWTRELHASVQLNEQGKIYPWDLVFQKTWYKKKHYNIDERVIAEYFPMESTVAGLLDIYRQFLSVEFETVPVNGFWHEEVKVIAAYNKDKTQLLGYLLLDLHPRPNKYSHACHITMTHALITKDGQRLPAVSTVLANFPKATADKPSLLTRNDVITFFHEFGHALHAMFGVTTLGGFSGTQVKRDFVELPSQMLEEWLKDKAILKKVSKHYKTGKPLPDAVIDRIVSLAKFDTGYEVHRMCVNSFLSLTLFGSGAHKDPHAILLDLQEKIYSHIVPHTESHMYANFWHLSGYAAKYYGYLWSQVFGLDMFYEIKKHGLLNPAIGARYVQEVISRGGTIDPNQILKNFLGREPNNVAFIEDMGLQKQTLPVSSPKKQVMPTA